MSAVVATAAYCALLAALTVGIVWVSWCALRGER